MALIDRNSFETYYQELLDEHKQELQPEISIVANQLQNGTDSILSSQHLMQNDAKPIEFHVKTTPILDNMQQEYQFLQLTQRCLLNKQFGNITAICIEGFDGKNMIDNT
eukprot:276770_1